MSDTSPLFWKLIQPQCFALVGVRLYLQVVELELQKEIGGSNIKYTLIFLKYYWKKNMDSQPRKLMETDDYEYGQLFVFTKHLLVRSPGLRLVGSYSRVIFSVLVTCFSRFFVASSEKKKVRSALLLQPPSLHLLLKKGDNAPPVDHVIKVSPSCCC